MALEMGNWSYNPTYRSYNPIYTWKGAHLVVGWILFRGCDSSY